MSNYVLTPEADLDLDEIWEYIAQDDIEAADKWDGKLREAFNMLARNSRAGHPAQRFDEPTCSFLACGRVPDHLSDLSRQHRNRRCYAGRAGHSLIPEALKMIEPRRRYKLACHGNNWLRYGDRYSFLPGRIDR